MFQAIYNSLSGLFSFSQGLNTISNNVSNMNTPGFRGSDSFFEDVAGGYGTKISGTGLRSTPGNPEQTGTATDLEITGEGFFILKDPNGAIFYTRDGQFTFNNQGFLTDSVNHFEVMSIDAAGNLKPININSFTTSQPQATATITVTGNMSSSNGAAFTLPAVTVYDAAGNAHAWTITMTPVQGAGSTSTDSFTISIKDENGNTISGATANNVISYYANSPSAGIVSGAPEAPSSFTYTADIDGKQQTVTVNFGTPDTTSGSTGLEGGSESASATADGHAAQGISSYSFDATGTLQISYASGTTVTGPQVALASFVSDSSLQQLGGNLISGKNEPPPTIGRPNVGVFGTITGGSLELSDVDLTQEFSTMIVIQRGYQASSRVMTVSNQMLEDLYNNSQGGGGS